VSNRIPVILDTDIGSDIDDAIALSYLLKQPRSELLGITTVSGDVQKRAALAEIICHAAGKGHIPIHCGRRDVLLAGPGQPNVPQYDAVKDLPHHLNRPENTAVEFLRHTIRSRPGEVVLLTIGPYSNAALLFALDPEIPFLVKQIVSMGGRFFTDPYPEWNVQCDPTAGAIVYAAKRKSHVSIGLDVTLQCSMSSAEVRSRFKPEPLPVVLQMAEEWFKHTDRVTFHDPLAATVIFKPELCGYDRGFVTVDVAQGGRTHFKEQADGPDEVAHSVHAEAFFEEYFSVF